MGDHARLQQVVWNLLSNAVKFTPQGGRIAVTLRRVQSAVEMEVVDTGEGIEADILPYIFDRFRQGDGGATRIHMGLGLGLAIVRHIVEMHGGHVAVRSEGKGTGAAFRLSFPAIARELSGSLADAGLSAAEAPAHPFPGLLAGMRALVIDDDPDARELLAAMLRVHGMVVSAAGSASEGMAALEREVPDIILSDLAMPDQDGYALIRSVRKLPADSGGRVPAIAVTAYARPEDSARSLSSGFQAHMVKPIDLMELVSVVERLATGLPKRNPG
jgi:CheY-like chemotaxis protein